MTDENDSITQQLNALTQRVQKLENTVEELNQKISPPAKTDAAAEKRTSITKLLYETAKRKRIKFLSKEIPARLTSMLLLLEKEKEATPSRLRSCFNISRQTLSRDIAILRKLEWTEFKGGTIGGFYKLTKNIEEFLSES